MVWTTLGFGDNFSNADRVSEADKFLAAVHGEHHEYGVGSDAGNLSSRIETVHHGHLQIQNNDVGGQVFELLNRIFPILCLATDLPIRSPLNAGADRFANHGTVVHDQDFRCHFDLHALGGS